ncbi:MAG: SDR family oxidoreductase [Proteobacteria bacterium]|nr:SDR family oxidoreductase [Pseudomonadota bacterium]
MPQKETVLITGASSGLGLELVRLFAADGADIVLVARRKDKLETLAAEIKGRGSEARVIAADLAEPDAPKRIHAELARAGVQIDVLVNNAGFGARGPLAESETQAEMLQVNISALTELSRLFLPGMIKRRRGGILNVASTAAFQPGPFMAVYYASKAYVLSFTEALAEEVRGTGVVVSCLAPGAFQTEFFEKAKMKGALLSRMGGSAEDVASIGYKGFRRGKVVVVPGFQNRLGAASVRFTPRFVVRRVVGKINRL